MLYLLCLVWGVITHYTLSLLRFDKARAGSKGRSRQAAGRHQDSDSWALSLIPVMGTGEEPGQPLPSEMRGCSKNSNPESQCLSIHPVPCYPNPLCAFTSEDNIMKHPNLSFVENSLELGKEAPFCPVPQCQPFMEIQAGTSVCYGVTPFWAGQVSSFLSFSVKKQAARPRVHFFPN